MGLPLLGLLALGGAAAGRGKITEMWDKQDAARFERSGVSFADQGAAGAMAQQFAEAGQQRSDFAKESTARAYQLQSEQQAAKDAMARQRVSSAAGMMNARTNLMKHEAEVETHQMAKQSFLDLGGTETAWNLPSLREEALATMALSPQDFMEMSPTVIAERERQAEFKRLTEENAIFTEQTKQQNQELQRDVDTATLLNQLDAADGTTQRTAMADAAYSEAVEPLLQQKALYIDASKALATPEGVGWGSARADTDQQRLNRRKISQALQVAQSQFWNQDMNRADAPTEEEFKRVATLFEAIKENPWSADNRGYVEGILNELNTQTQRDIDLEASRREAAISGDPLHVVRELSKNIQSDYRPEGVPE